MASTWQALGKPNPSLQACDMLANTLGEACHLWLKGMANAVDWTFFLTFAA
jgi:hypothetical protein